MFFAAATHEVPREPGDFIVLIHGGCSKPRAVLIEMLAVELTQRTFQIKFRGTRDADTKLLKEDLEWLPDLPDV